MDPHKRIDSSQHIPLPASEKQEEDKGWLTRIAKWGKQAATEKIKNKVIYPEEQINQELNEASANLKKNFPDHNDAAVIDGLIDYGIAAAEKWIATLPPEDKIRSSYESAVKFLSKGYIDKLVHMLFSRTLSHLAERYRQERGLAVNANFDAVDFGNFLIEKLNGCVAGVSKEDLKSRDKFKGPAEQILAVLLPHGVQDLPGGRLVGNILFTKVWAQINDAAADALMQYAALKLDYDVYAIDLAKGTQDLNAMAAPQDQKATKALFDHAWEKGFEYGKAHLDEFIPAELKEHFQQMGGIEQFMQRQVEGAEANLQLHGFSKQLLLPLILRVVSLPEKDGEAGLARFLSDVKNVLDTYAKRHTSITEEEREGIKTYDDEIAKFKKEIADLQLEVDAILPGVETEESLGIVDESVEVGRLKEAKENLEAKKKEHKAYVGKHGAAINKLKEKAQMSIWPFLKGMLDALGIGKEIPNPVDYNENVAVALKGLKDKKIPPAAVEAIAKYNAFRADLGKAVAAEATGVQQVDLKLANDSVNELVEFAAAAVIRGDEALIQKGVEQAKAYAVLLFGEVEGQKKEQIVWLLDQALRVGLSTGTTAEVKAFLEPFVLRLLSHRKERAGMDGQETLQQVCQALSREVVAQIKAKASASTVESKHLEQFVSLFLEEYLSCVAMNLKRDPSMEGKGVELLFNKMGQIVQKFLKAHQKELQGILASNEEAPLKQEKLEAIFADLSKELKDLIIPEGEAAGALIDRLVPPDLPFAEEIKVQVKEGIKTGWEENVPAVLTRLFTDLTKGGVRGELLLRLDEKAEITPIDEALRLVAHQVVSSLPPVVIGGADATADTILKNVFKQLHLKEKDVKQEDLSHVKKALINTLKGTLESAAFDREGRQLLEGYITVILKTFALPLIGKIKAVEADRSGRGLSVQLGTGIVKAIATHLQTVQEALKASGKSKVAELEDEEVESIEKERAFAPLKKQLESLNDRHLQYRVDLETLEFNGGSASQIAKKQKQIEIIRQKIADLTPKLVALQQESEAPATVRAQIGKNEERLIQHQIDLHELKQQGASEKKIAEKRMQIEAIREKLSKLKAKEFAGKKEFLKSQVDLFFRLSSIH